MRCTFPWATGIDQSVPIKEAVHNWKPDSATQPWPFGSFQQVEELSTVPYASTEEERLESL